MGGIHLFLGFITSAEVDVCRYQFGEQSSLLMCTLDVFFSMIPIFSPLYFLHLMTILFESQK